MIKVNSSVRRCIFFLCSQWYYLKVNYFHPLILRMYLSACGKLVLKKKKILRNERIFFFLFIAFMTNMPFLLYKYSVFYLFFQNFVYNILTFCILKFYIHTGNCMCNIYACFKNTKKKSYNNINILKNLKKKNMLRANK